MQRPCGRGCATTSLPCPPTELHKCGIKRSGVDPPLSSGWWVVVVYFGPELVDVVFMRCLIRCVGSLDTSTWAGPGSKVNGQPPQALALVWILRFGKTHWGLAVELVTVRHTWGECIGVGTSAQCVSAISQGGMA